MLKKILGGILLALVNLQDAMAATSTCMTNIIPSAYWASVASGLPAACVTWCQSQGFASGQLTSVDAGACYSRLNCLCGTISCAVGEYCGSIWSYSNYNYAGAGTYNASCLCVYSSFGFQCINTHYGVAFSSLWSSAQLETYKQRYASGCKPCPTSGAYVIAMTNVHTSGISACVLVAGQSHSDTTGKWTYATNCPYSS